jgi:hypothetical protein
MSAINAARAAAPEAPAYRPMRETDVDAVARVEAELQSHPWTPGNFRDALVAGNSCWIVASGDDIAAYGVLMMGVGEAHLLTLGVARRSSVRTRCCWRCASAIGRHARCTTRPGFSNSACGATTTRRPRVARTPS